MIIEQNLYNYVSDQMEINNCEKRKSEFNHINGFDCYS